MCLRFVAAASAILLSPACATRSVNPPVREAAATAVFPVASEVHFVAEDGSPLPAYEPVWVFLRTFYDAAMPARVTIVLVDGSGGEFDAARSRIVLGRDELKAEGPALVAHETSHLCLAVLTRGASATDAFRFLDEGFASILEARSDNREAEYADEALTIAAAELQTGRVSFALAQRWSEYFGDWQGRVNNSSRPRNFHAYRVGASFDLWVKQRYGEPRLRDLFVAIGKTGSLDAALIEVLGKPASAVEADWKASLSSVKIPDDTPSIVALVPADGTTDVSADLTEISARFSAPMNRSVVNLGADCATGICFTNASWTSATVLSVRLPAGLKRGTRYTVTLGVEGHTLRSRYGHDLPVTTWRFTTE